MKSKYNPRKSEGIKLPIYAVRGLYKILDKNGDEMPDHYSGRKHTCKEAKKMIERLNKDGEYKPYIMVMV